MAFKASSIILVKAYEQIKQYAAAIKREAERLNTDSSSGPVSADRIIGFVETSAQMKTYMQQLASVSGLAAYAQAQEDDQTYDVVSEYTTMIAGINGVIAWVDSNFPQDGSGYLLKDQMAADGTITAREFSTAATAGMRTQLTALISLID